jgi:hypothetical protein
VVTPSRTFVVDPERVVHETIEGETILINLEAGTYHSLLGSGPELWRLLAAGAPEGEIVKALTERHGADEQRVAADTARLIDELERQGLITPGEPSGQAVAPAEADPPASQGFATPELQSFDDMKYLLMLDPIHDFEAGDWPSQQAGGPDGRAAA